MKLKIKIEKSVLVSGIHTIAQKVEQMIKEKLKAKYKVELDIDINSYKDLVAFNVNIYYESMGKVKYHQSTMLLYTFFNDTYAYKAFKTAALCTKDLSFELPIPRKLEYLFK